MKNIFRTIIDHAHILIVSLAAFSLRLINLGYSDYQGDEIKSFFILGDNQSLVDFLLNQRKGPGQFIVTLLVKQINPDYSNELVTRLLFALAGSLAVFFFFKFIENILNKKTAFYASLFFATNGFLVALSRISQYQSFVIFFMILALYKISLAVKYNNHNKRNLFLAFLFWAFSILFHYDGIFIAPIFLYFLYVWVRKNVENFNKNDDNFKFLLYSLLITSVLLGLFYIPFVINLSQNTLAYWEGRISGDVSAKLSSSKYLFTVYQPIYALHFYTLLFFSGIFYIFSPYFKRYFFKIKLTKLLPDFGYQPKVIIFVLVWFFIPIAFLEGIIYIPGTHIYSYLIPMFIILSLGIVFIERFLEGFKKYFIPSVITFSGLSLLFSFLYLQSYAIFVEHGREYPWESEKFLLWQFPEPTPIFHLSMFGFPYYRDWEGISNVVMSSNNNGYYSTNERQSIARFYVPLLKSTDNAGHFIHILNPQSFTREIQQEKALYWAERYPPVFSFSKSGKDLVRVYLMEAGTKEEVIEKGY